MKKESACVSADKTTKQLKDHQTPTVKARPPTVYGTRVVIGSWLHRDGWDVKGGPR
jgi:hypothetical protein